MHNEKIVKNTVALLLYLHLTIILDFTTVNPLLPGRFS